MRRAVLLAISLAGAIASAQAPAPLISPEVHPDKTVTFRFRAPNAKAAMLAREGDKAMPMTKDEQGVWSYTTPALEPDLYGYSIVVDGVALIDPSNALMKPNLLFTQSMVHVPGNGLPWEVADVPRGELHHHFYKSGIVGDHRDYFVYTPPGYSPKAKTKYPVLYLLHGFSDDASGWTAVGQAHVILDNLISQGKAKPMLIVMTLGYGAPEIVSRTQGGVRDPNVRERNMTRFRDALFQEVMPAVEKEYRVDAKPQGRAIAGLSMGGAETLFTSLNSPDKFTYVGAFSSGGLGNDMEKTFPNLTSKVNAQFKLLWVACGTEDGLIGANRKFLEFLQSKDVKFTRVETPGAHTWMVWRRNLAEFAPQLFR